MSRIPDFVSESKDELFTLRRVKKTQQKHLGVSLPYWSNKKPSPSDTSVLANIIVPSPILPINNLESTHPQHPSLLSLDDH